MNRRVLFFLLSLLLLPAAQAQRSTATHDEVGRPFLTCYGLDDHAGDYQNWDVVQDGQGVLYFANNLGVLEFDGAAWNLIETPGKNVVRSLDIDADGRIYVGSLADVGYLAPDAAGQLQYVSLVEHIPEELRAFNDVWTTHVTDAGIYFLSRERLFRFSASAASDAGAPWTVQTWEPEERFMYAFWLDGTYYVHQGGVGLMQMAGDRLALVPGGRQFAHERLMVMLPFDDAGRFLVGPWNSGLFLFDGRSFQPFPNEANAFLSASTLYKGTVLPDGSFGLVTIAGGGVVVGRDGTVRLRLNQASGLTGSSVTAVFVDRSGLLWLAPENGICQVETPSPLTRFDAADGLTGTVEDMLRHQGRLYVTTSDGVFYLDAGDARFKRVLGVVGNPQSFDLRSDGEALLVASGQGLYRVDGATARPIKQNVAGSFASQSLHHARQDPRRLFVGLIDGLAALRREASGRWIDEGRLEGIHEYVTHIAESEPGVLWLGTASSLVQVRFAGASLDDPTIKRFGVEHGLPTGGVSVFEADGRIVFATKDGVFRFDAAAEHFAPDTLFRDIVAFGGSQDDYTVVEDDAGHLWVNFGKETAVLRRRRDGAYRADKTALLRFAEAPATNIYPDDRGDGVVWFGGNASLIRYDPAITKDYAVDYPALVRRVRVGADSVLYGGAVAAEEAIPALRFADNALRFEYAATSYENPVETQYRSMLEGFDAGWSAWTKETRRDYTNLPPGAYTFRVRAKNIYGHESAEAAFALTVLPPWYRTWWAYGLYAALAVGLVFGLVRQRTRHLEVRQRELEQTVEERTAEIQQRVEELAVINSVQEGLVAELDIQAIYDLVGDRIRDLFDAQVVLVATFDHAAGLEQFHYVIEKGARHYPAPRPFEGLRRHLIETRQLVLVNEHGEQAMARFGMRVLPGTDLPKSSLFVPLVVGETVKGYVSLQNVDHEHAFSDSDVRLLTTLANSMSVALENARLFDETNRLLAETEQRAAELDTVNHISRALVAQLEFDALVQLVGEQMRETFQASIVYVALHDKATNMVHFPYEYGDETPSRPFGSGLTEKIITTGEPLLINRDLEEVRAQLQAEQIGKAPMSYLGVPILVGDEAIGVISVQSTEEEGRFDEDALRLLNTIAANVGVALHNAEAYRQLGATLEDLKTTQEQLVTQEKMASLGALTAGIAHEIKNPLNFVNNFAEVNQELTTELFEEIEANPDLRVADIQDMLTHLRINAVQIVKHGKRADAIVKNMMEHASGSGSERYPVGVNAFVEEYVNLAYHGMKAQAADLTVAIARDYDAKAGTVEMVPQEMGRVVVNLLNNALEAVREHAGRVNGTYRPEVSISTRKRDRAVEIRVHDNGPGIPPAVREKIFEPFFTTKPAGSGTGLGLSLSYDIVVQGHGGTLTVESDAGQGATFVVTLPG